MNKTPQPDILKRFTLNIRVAKMEFVKLCNAPLNKSYLPIASLPPIEEIEKELGEDNHG